MRHFVFSVLLFFTALGFAGIATQALADGADYGGPPCIAGLSQGSCDYFQLSIEVDLGAFAKQVAVVQPPQNDRPDLTGECSDYKYTEVPSNESVTWQEPTGLYQPHPLFLKKEFFEQNGLTGLFDTKIVRSDDTKCTSTVMTVKDQKSLTENSIRIAIPVDDFVGMVKSYSYTITSINGGGLYMDLADMPEGVFYQQTSLPNIVTFKKYYYRPGGFYCSKVDPSWGCNTLVLYRYKEVWTLDDGTTEEHDLPIPSNLEYLTPTLQVAAATSMAHQALPKHPVMQPAITTPVSSASSTPAKGIHRSFMSLWWCTILSWFSKTC